MCSSAQDTHRQTHYIKYNHIVKKKRNKKEETWKQPPVVKTKQQYAKLHREVQFANKNMRELLP